VSALEPGIYRATVCGIPDTIVTVKPGVYSTTYAVGRYNEDQHRDITDARPLIVLDLGGAADTAARNLRALHSATADIIADQIEAQTKPARIPEPGWGEKVRARTLGNGHEREFLRYKADDPDFRWADGCEQYLWSALIDPTLIREGI